MTPADPEDQSYTVVIPAFNAARTLAAAIDSALQQDPPPLAIVVVDDGSTDDTARIACSFGSSVTLDRQERQGPGAATDRALNLVRTPFVAGLDADDLWFSGKAQRQLKTLRDDTALDGVFCRARIFRHGSDPLQPGPVQDLWGRSAMMLRTSGARQMGSIEGSSGNVAGEMIGWFDAGRQLGLRLAMLPDVLVGRRIIEGSLSFGQDAAKLMPMIRNRLRARRARSQID